MASKRLYSAAALAALALCGCSAGTMTLTQARQTCAADRSSAHHVEVYVPAAAVVRVLGERESYSGYHEGFLIADATGIPVRVEVNTSITGPIPLHRGEAVSLLGQYECDDGVMHWTHHDPSGRHLTGYVKVDGRTYQ